jgi:hypothetical protein
VDEKTLEENAREKAITDNIIFLLLKTKVGIAYIDKRSRGIFGDRNICVIVDLTATCE